jgi:hypothetical protein
VYVSNGSRWSNAYAGRNAMDWRDRPERAGPDHPTGVIDAGPGPRTGSIVVLRLTPVVARRCAIDWCHVRRRPVAIQDRRIHNASAVSPLKTTEHTSFVEVTSYL